MFKVVVVLVFAVVFSEIATADDRAVSSCMGTLSASKNSDYEGEGFKYLCQVDACSLSVDVDRQGDDSYVSTGYSITRACRDLPYSVKLPSWAYLLEQAKNDGVLVDLKRAGPGPGPEMCRGSLRSRLIKSAASLLSPNKRSIVMDDVEIVWAKASIFREYLEIFEQVGYPLQLSDFEGVVIRQINRDEILANVPVSNLAELYIPCNAMTYFEPRKED